MRYEVTAEYSDALVRTASRRFLVKFFGWQFLGIWFFMLACLVLLLALGEHGWLAGVLGAPLILAPIAVASVSIGCYRRALTALRKLGTPRVQWVFDDTGISVQSDLSTGSIKWPMVERLWCFPEVWLLFVAKGVYSMLPVSCLSEDLQSFILQKAQEAGIRISPPAHGIGRDRA
jgi:hypothetical protein